MTAYADTGFLCSLYAPDAHSHRAILRMKRQELPLPITWLHQLELRNALRLRVFRREIIPLPLFFCAPTTRAIEEHLA